MNKVILMGRLTRDPEVRYSQGENAQAFATFTLAVDRRMRRSGTDGGDQQQQADFLRCVTFGRQAEFAEKYLHQGTKIALTGRIQTGSYTNRDGQKVYTTDIVVEDMEFAESKAANDSYRARNAGSMQAQDRPQSQPQDRPAPSGGADVLEGFMNIPDTIDEDLPFN